MWLPDRGQLILEIIPGDYSGSFLAYFAGQLLRFADNIVSVNVTGYHGIVKSHKFRWH